jgi:squalene-associated FAD-dependent desaturase
MSSGRVTVIGGGLGGIAAALDCAAAGARVTLVEVRPRVGGAAYSFERDGLQIDNGAHVFLRCCTAYRALLERLGSAGGVRVQERLEIPVRAPDGRRAVLRRNGLPAPAHLLPALARYRFLTAGERLRAIAAARALGHVDPTSAAVDEQSLGAWLQRHGQGERAVASLWDLIALPTLNVRAREASLALGAFVFRTGLLEDGAAGDIGFHVEPLSAVIGRPALHALRESGVEVLLRERALAIVTRPCGTRPSAGAAGGGAEVAAVELGDARRVEADAVILALPHARAADLLPQELSALGARIRSLASSPIVNLHVLYDRPVCEEPFFGAVESPVQYVFDRSAASGLEPGRFLSVSLSGASGEMALTPEALRARYVPALAELLPAARGAGVERFLVTREHAATFAPTPGSGALRPSARTAVGGLALAGSWTDTGWPATLEGAVRSGHAAADVALAHLGIAGPGAAIGLREAAAHGTGEALGRGPRQPALR